MAPDAREPDVPSVRSDEEVLRRVPKSFYPDPEQPQRPQWQTFRPREDEETGISVDRRELTTLTDASYNPERTKQSHLARLSVGSIHQINLSVIADELRTNPAHALIPEINASYYTDKKSKKRMQKLAFQLREIATMILIEEINAA